MDTAVLSQQISAEHFDLDQFVQMAIDEPDTRDEIVQQMVSNPNIMVYYHCYYVISKASQVRPELFYSYWHQIAPLLNHPNSYHRNFALTILANLTRVDHENLFSRIFTDYFEHLHDDRLTTAICCVQNSKKIYKQKLEFQDQIMALLLDIDHQCSYPEKQKELLKSHILEIIDEIYSDVINKRGIDEFIMICTTSISPKTRSKAKGLVQKFRLLANG